MSTPNYPTIEEMRRWVELGGKLVKGTFCRYDMEGKPCGVCALTAAAVLRGAVTLPKLAQLRDDFDLDLHNYWDAQALDESRFYHGFDQLISGDTSPDYAAGAALRRQCEEEGLLTL